MGSVVVAQGLSLPKACGIVPGQGSNPRTPIWQADSQPLDHWGSPSWTFVKLQVQLVLGSGTLLLVGTTLKSDR